MNCRRHTRPPLYRACCGLLLILAAAMPAWAQDSEGLPSDLKTKVSLSRADRTRIDEFVQGHAQRLQQDGGTQQSDSREALISAASMANRQTPTAAYLDAYVTSLASALAPVVENPDLRIRLNAAVVVGKVAAHTQAPQLRDLAVQLIKDQSPAVALWGIKSARAIIPSVLANPQLREEDGLRAVVIPAVQAHAESPLSGHIATEAYQVLTIDLFSGHTINNDIIATVIGYAQDLLAERLKQFQLHPPRQPLAEQAATQFLVHPQVWAVQTPEQRQRTVHLLSDLISLTAQRLAEADTAEQGDLRHMVEQTAKAIVVAADSTGASSISAAASPLTSLERQADPQQVLQLVQGIHPAVVEVPAYAQTPPPPQVAAAPSTQQAEPEDEAADDDAADADDAGEAEMGTDDADDAAADDDAADDDTAEQPGDAADNTDVAAPDADAPTAEPADAPAPEAPATP